jgi:fructan beta-fructosidase
MRAFRLLFVILPWCFGPMLSTVAADLPYAEPHRPQFHYSPPAHWMNDPNGLVWFEGEYHLFYQYYPSADRWGPMHWGHAVSSDLVRWHTLPVALRPDERGYIFSGSVVVDRDNTSGLGTAGHPALVALFTYHDEIAKSAGSERFQSQGLAYSVDRGRTWTKYPGNPVLPNPGERDFRDPKVFWHAGTSRWIATLAVGDHVAFYSSSDLLHWAHESDFGRDVGAHGGVWECPDLFPAAVSGDARGAVHWVLLASILPGGPNGGSATQYFTGTFDGHRFLADATPAAARWLDYGPDDYAGVTWSDAPTDARRRLFIGWMSNWRYAQSVPTSPWRSAMTLPRELKLVEGADGYALKARPVAQLSRLRRRSVRLAPRPISAPFDLTAAARMHGSLLELELRVGLAPGAVATLSLGNDRGERTTLALDRAGQRYVIDRSRSGDVGFNEDFATPATAPMPRDRDEVALRLYLDTASLEAFFDDGETVMTSIHFPSSPFDHVRIEGRGGVTLRAASVHELISSARDGRPDEPA